MFRKWFTKVEVVTVEAQILELKPDDVLVLSYEYNLSDQQYETLKKQFANYPVGKNKILLLEGGGKLSILR